MAAKGRKRMEDEAKARDGDGKMDVDERSTVKTKELRRL